MYLKKYGAIEHSPFASTVGRASSNPPSFGNGDLAIRNRGGMDNSEPKIKRMRTVILSLVSEEKATTFEKDLRIIILWVY